MGVVVYLPLSRNRRDQDKYTIRFAAIPRRIMVVNYLHRLHQRFARHLHYIKSIRIRPDSFVPTRLGLLSRFDIFLANTEFLALQRHRIGLIQGANHDVFQVFGSLVYTAAESILR